MESKMEYRDKTAQDIRLPREVYYRCIWTVRDVTRLRELAQAAGFENGSGENAAAYDARDSEDCRTDKILSEDVIARAVYDVRCINAALQKVPDVYRKGVMDNIVSKVPFDDLAHPNTWKRWKLVFLYELARELSLI